MSDPRQLGSYELITRIGEGGMGEVWHGVHRHLSRDAAIKVIKPSAAGGDTVERFQREARATSALKSPHTIQLFDFGVAEDGTFFYAMELLEGCSLQELVDHHGPVCPERVIHLLKQACESLVEAHYRGLVHRDIKPANVFLCRLGMEVDFVKLLDFGLVKLDVSASRRGTTLTAEGVATGTPAFMPPEVVSGSATFDARSDLYALGCVAYWLLTGKLVFEADTPLEAIMAHIQQQPERPSLRTGLPICEELDQLVMDCLRKDPDERPQSAEDLLTRLRAIEVEVPWTHERAASWWGKHHPESWGGQPATTSDLHEVGTQSLWQPADGSRPPGGFWALLGGAVVLAVAAVVWTMFPSEPPEPQSAGAAAPEPEPEPEVKPAQPDKAPDEAAVEKKCTVWAAGPSARWSSVTASLSDHVTWASTSEPPTDVSAMLRHTAQKMESGAERWRSCRSVVLSAGGQETEVCRECMTREYTFATIEAVEAWHRSFISSLGAKCTDSTIAAVDAHCGDLGQRRSPPC